jgi:DNA-binding transcriptional regulator GbsR (MarR family)
MPPKRRPPDSTPADPAAVDRAIERLGAQFAAVGIPRMSARLYAAILTSPQGGLTAAELGERLQVSPATVSKAMQYLLQVELVQRGYVPGTRKDRYVLGKDLWSEMFHFRERWLHSLADAAGESVTALGGEKTEAGARVAKLRDFSNFAATEMTAMLERWQRKQQS